MQYKCQLLILLILLISTRVSLPLTRANHLHTTAPTPTDLLNPTYVHTLLQPHPIFSSSTTMASYQETKREEKRTNMSPEEIGKYRAEAQQNSVEAIRAAEERYNKAKEASGGALHDTKEAITHGAGATTAYLAAKGAEAKDKAAQGAHVAAQKGQQGYEVAKDYTQQAAEKTKDATVAAAAKAKDVSLSAGETVVDYAKQAAETAAEYTKQGAVKAKDVTVGTGQAAADYAKQGAVKAKDVTVGTGKTAVDYTKQEALKAKDTAKSAEDYVCGKMARGEAAEAEQRTKEYGGERAGEIEEAAGGATQRAREYAEEKAPEAKEVSNKAMGFIGEKAGEAKDATLSSGQKAVDYAKQKAEGAKESAKSMGQQAKEYAWQKGEEAKRTGGELGDQMSEYTGKKEQSKEEYGTEEKLSKIEPGKDLKQEEVVTVIAPELTEEEKGSSATAVGALCETVGEAVIEIAKTAKDVTAGEEPEKYE